MNESIKVTIVGYWAPPEQYPDAKEHVNKEWYAANPEAKEALCIFLACAGEEANAYKGMSRCRICGKNNGSTERSDGEYLWPSGLAHYVKEHDVLPPNKRFILHAFSQVGLGVVKTPLERLKESRK